MLLNYHKNNILKMRILIGEKPRFYNLMKTWNGSRRYTPSHTSSWAVRRIYSYLVALRKELF